MFVCIHACLSICAVRYGILRSCLCELMRVGLVAPAQQLPADCSSVRAQLESIFPRSTTSPHQQGQLVRRKDGQQASAASKGPRGADTSSSAASAGRGGWPLLVLVSAPHVTEMVGWNGLDGLDGWETEAMAGIRSRNACWNAARSEPASTSGVRDCSSMSCDGCESGCADPSHTSCACNQQSSSSSSSSDFSGSSATAVELGLTAAQYLFVLASISEVE